MKLSPDAFKPHPDPRPGPTRRRALDLNRAVVRNTSYESSQIQNTHGSQDETS